MSDEQELPWKDAGYADRRSPSPPGAEAGDFEAAIAAFGDAVAERMTALLAPDRSTADYEAALDASAAAREHLRAAHLAAVQRAREEGRREALLSEYAARWPMTNGDMGHRDKWITEKLAALAAERSAR